MASTTTDSTESLTPASTPPQHNHSPARERQASPQQQAQPPGAANISIRDYIYYLPFPYPVGAPIPYTINLPHHNPLELAYAPSEPTHTLVLTSPASAFVDLRVLKGVRVGDAELPNLTHMEGRGKAGNEERLDWAFAGQSLSVEASGDVEVEVEKEEKEAGMAKTEKEKPEMSTGKQANDMKENGARDVGKKKSASNLNLTKEKPNTNGNLTKDNPTKEHGAKPTNENNSGKKENTKDENVKNETSKKNKKKPANKKGKANAENSKHSQPAPHPSRSNNQTGGPVQVPYDKYPEPSMRGGDIPDLIKLDNPRYCEWHHWVDNRHPVDATNIPLDNGLMFTIPNTDLSLEHGNAEDPHRPGVWRTHEEMWRDVPIFACAPSPNRVCIVLRTEGEAAGQKWKGVIIRLGQFIQGIIKRGDETSVERWEFIEAREAEEKWTRTVRIGAHFLPCLATADEEELKVGMEINANGCAWVVEELVEW